MSRSLARRLAVLALTAIVPLPLASVAAQDPDPLSRLDPQNRFAIEMILDSAHAAGVPTRPLMSKAFEGVSKRADQRRIVVAVRSLYLALRDARTALGPSLSETEWSAAAAAIQAGVPVPVLARFKPDKPGTKPLARALIVLADLITRGVPVDVASSTMVSLWQKGAGDADFYGLWHDVEQDILSGSNPGAALQQRARELPDRSGQSIPNSPARPPETA